MNRYDTIYFVAVMVLTAGGGMLYHHLAGKAFDSKYGRGPE